MRVVFECRNGCEESYVHVDIMYEEMNSVKLNQMAGYTESIFTQVAGLFVYITYRVRERSSQNC